MARSFVATEAFERDYDSTLAYLTYELGAPMAALRMMDAIDCSIEKVLDNPFLNAVSEKPTLEALGYREECVGNYMMFYTTEGDRIVAVANRTEAKALELASRFGVDTVYSNNADLLADERIEAVYVATLNTTHYEALKAAHDAGDADKVKLYAEILYDQALLVNGLEIADPAAYAQKIFGLMK